MIDVGKVVAEFETLHNRLEGTRQRLEQAERENAEYRRTLGRPSYRALGSLLGWMNR